MKYLLSVLLSFTLVSLQSQNCFPNGIVFNSQEELDQFEVDFPNCVEIGSVLIEGPGITSLDPLKNLRIISAEISIQDCPNLKTLDGIIDLNQILGGLTILRNDSLEFISGFNELVILNGLDISRNDNLIRIIGFNQIIELGVGSHLRRNPNLKEVNIFQSLEKVNGFVNFVENDSYVDIAGFNKLRIIEGDLNFTLRHEKFISGLNKLDSIMGRYWFQSAFALKHFDGLSNVTFVGDGILVQECDSLRNLNGFKNLKEIKDGGISIDLTKSLVDISALKNLNIISGWVNISRNESLTSLKGIQNIDPATIVIIRVHDNPLLTDCSYLSICESYSNLLTESFKNNGFGCNTNDEMFAGCVADTTALEFNLCQGEVLQLADTSYTDFGYFEQNLISCRGLDSLLQITINEADDCGDCGFSLPTHGYHVYKKDTDAFILRSDTGSIGFENEQSIIEFLESKATANNKFRRAENQINFSAKDTKDLLRGMKIGSSLKL